MDCLFCKIIAGEIPGNKVYEDENIFAFRDINPQAPVHVLIVPKRHMENILECDGETMQHVLNAIKRVAQLEGIPLPDSALSPIADATARSRSSIYISTCWEERNFPKPWRKPEIRLSRA